MGLRVPYQGFRPASLSPIVSLGNNSTNGLKMKYYTFLGEGSMTLRTESGSPKMQPVSAFVAGPWR